MSYLTYKLVKLAVLMVLAFFIGLIFGWKK